MDELKKGQEVVIKSAKGLSGMIASRDDGAEGHIARGRIFRIRVNGESG